MIEQILLMPDIKNSPKLSKNQENFLLSLLKDNKTDIFKEIVKNLKISKEDFIDLIKKEPKEIQSKLLQIIKHIDFKSDFEKPILKTLFENKEYKSEHTKKKEKIFENLHTFLNTFINEKITTTPHTEKKIVEVIKKEIISKTNLKNHIFTKKELLEFKKIENLKDLISFANKKGLNIQKIKISKPAKEEILKIIRNNSQEMKTLEIKPKIVIPKIKTQKLNLHSSFEQKIPKILNKTHKTDKNISLISELFSKNTKKALKETDMTQNTLSLNSLLKKDKKTEKQKEEITLFQPHANTNIINELKHNILKAKESIKHFANNLKEAVENYKPPISKVSLELHPKELGKVEITLIHRGENLQIHINGQNQTINFFNQYQNDLKNVLVNMGYSDVNMSFNQNQNQQKNQEKYRQNQNFSLNEEDEFIIEIPYQYA
ncbi:flagellar hook-length control protein FliK [Caminibacter sp.]